MLLLGLILAAAAEPARPAGRVDGHCTVRAAHCFQGRAGFFEYDLCTMASSNRTYVLAAQPPPGAAPGLLMPYAVAAPGGLANVSGCATCTSSRRYPVPPAPGFQLPSAPNGTLTAWQSGPSCTSKGGMGHCLPLSSAPMATEHGPSVMPTTRPATSLLLRYPGGVPDSWRSPLPLIYNLTCCHTCPSDSPPTAIRLPEMIVDWPTRSACGKWVAEPAEPGACSFPTPLPRPTATQLARSRMEISALIHFNMQTSLFATPTYKLSSCGGNDNASLFSPDRLNTDQWVQSIIDLGAEQAILTSKHQCGFALWPTQAEQPPTASPDNSAAAAVARRYQYSVANSSWRNGTGDVLGEFVASCRRRGLGHGLYFSHGLKQNSYAQLQGWSVDQVRQCPHTHSSQVLLLPIDGTRQTLRSLPLTVKLTKRDLILCVVFCLCLSQYEGVEKQMLLELWSQYGTTEQTNTRTIKTEICHCCLNQQQETAKETALIYYLD